MRELMLIKEKRKISKPLYPHRKTHGRTLAERIEALSMPIPECGCWFWVGAIDDDRGGYGALTYKKKCWAAHRASYTAFVGPVPDELCVCHKCDNRWCVNP